MNQSHLNLIEVKTPIAAVSSTPSASTNQVSTNNLNLHSTYSVVPSSHSLVAIQRNSDIAWVSSPTPNGHTRPVFLDKSKERNHFLAPVMEQQVSIVQHVRPTRDQRHFSANDSILQEANNSSNHSSSSTSNVELVEIPQEPVNYMEDVGLDDSALIAITTTDLNHLLKKKCIRKARQKKIKDRRRTLKNRGTYKSYLKV